MAAAGCFLLVVTGGHAPPGEDEDEALEYRFLDVRSRSQRSCGRLPISTGARLRWIGLSEEFAPVCIDTAGVVRALLGTGPGSWGPAGGGGGEWVPVLSLAEEEQRVGPLWA